MSTEALQSADLSYTKITDPQAAGVEIDRIRSARVAGTLRATSDEYTAMIDHLHRVKSGEQSTITDPRSLTMEQRFDQQDDEQMRPAKPEEYRFDYGDFELEDGDLETDREMRSALSSRGIPAAIGGPLISDVIRPAMDQYFDADPQLIESKIAEATSQLRSLWGNDYDRRSGQVHECVQDLVKNSALLGSLPPWVWKIDVRAAAWLGRMYEHQDRVASRSSRTK